MQPGDYIEANRKMWNETAGVHAQFNLSRLQERVKSPDFSTFDEVEKRIFANIDLRDKAVIQLGCNNGRELISVKKAGAGRCVGIDISDNFIAQARQLASSGQVDMDFIRSSVYDLAHDFDGQFDLVYISIGFLGWLPDLNALFGIASRLLKDDGQIFIYEMHPILNMFNAEKGLVIDTSYFARESGGQVEPFVEEASPDYLDPSQLVNAVSYWFPHKLSDVITACLEHHLSLTHFQEYAHDISEVYAQFEHFEKKLPLCYSLVARKTT